MRRDPTKQIDHHLKIFPLIRRDSSCIVVVQVPRDEHERALMPAHWTVLVVLQKSQSRHAEAAHVLMMARAERTELQRLSTNGTA